MRLVKRNKKGQSEPTGAPVATLVVVIALLMILYILFIPPAERAELLGENDSDKDDRRGRSFGDDEILIEESPGRLDFLSKDEIEHALPTVNIYTRTEGQVIDREAALFVSRSLFSSESENFTFDIPDLDNTENVLLAFNVNQGEGRLRIRLNGFEVYDGLPGASPDPVPLRAKNLEERNQLVFEVSSPGLAFWRTNNYALEDIRIIADVTSVTAQEAKNVFLVSATEKENVERATLKFSPDCNINEVDKLNVFINGVNLYSGVPDCGIGIIPIEFDEAILRDGSNELVFRTDRGAYFIDHIIIESELEEVEYPTYYFELSEEEYQDVKDNSSELRLELDFVDVTKIKEGEIEFNGRLSRFDTDDINYTKDLARDAVRGNNALQVRPKKSSLEIRDLRIILED